MPSYATATITGHMTQPEQRYSSKGIAIASFSLPVNDRELKDGEWVDAPTTWWRITAFGGLADRVMKMDKGTLLTVMGRAKLRPWTAQGGEERQSLEVVASEIQFLARPRNAPEVSHATTNERTSDPASIDDDISSLPF
jgi:single-strand DNA-binding protein